MAKGHRAMSNVKEAAGWETGHTALQDPGTGAWKMCPVVGCGTQAVPVYEDARGEDASSVCCIQAGIHCDGMEAR